MQTIWPLYKFRHQKCNFLVCWGSYAQKELNLLPCLSIVKVIFSLCLWICLNSSYLWLEKRVGGHKIGEIYWKSSCFLLRKREIPISLDLGCLWKLLHVKTGSSRPKRLAEPARLSTPLSGQHSLTSAGTLSSVIKVYQECIYIDMYSLVLPCNAMFTMHSHV